MKNNQKYSVPWFGVRFDIPTYISIWHTKALFGGFRPIAQYQGTIYIHFSKVSNSHFWISVFGGFKGLKEAVKDWIIFAYLVKTWSPFSWLCMAVSRVWLGRKLIKSSGLPNCTHIHHRRNLTSKTLKGLNSKLFRWRNCEFFKSYRDVLCMYYA